MPSRRPARIASRVGSTARDGHTGANVPAEGEGPVPCPVVVSPPPGIQLYFPSGRLRRVVTALLVVADLPAREKGAVTNPGDCRDPRRTRSSPQHGGPGASATRTRRSARTKPRLRLPVCHRGIGNRRVRPRLAALPATSAHGKNPPRPHVSCPFSTRRLGLHNYSWRLV